MTLAFSAGDAAYWGLAIFLVLLGVGSLFALVKLGQMFDKVSSLVGGAERDALPVVVKTGGTVDRVELPARQAGHRHRQRGLDGGQRRHGGESGIDCHLQARREGVGLHGGRRSRIRLVPKEPEHVGCDGRGQGRSAATRGRSRRRISAAQARRHSRASARRLHRHRRLRRSQIRGRDRSRRRSPTRRRSRPTSFPDPTRPSGRNARMRPNTARHHECSGARAARSRERIAGRARHEVGTKT